MPLTRDWVEAAADLAVTASGGHRTGIACPPKKAVREAASRLFHFNRMHHRAGPPSAPPSIAPLARSPTAPGPMVLAVCHRSLTPTDRHPLDVMAGLGPATHVLGPSALPRRGSPDQVRG